MLQLENSRHLQIYTFAERCLCMWKLPLRRIVLPSQQLQLAQNTVAQCTMHAAG